jgi:HK97 family phage prohead protease
MNLELRSRTAELRVAASDDGTRTLEGLIPYNSLSCDIWDFRELIAPGAFASALESAADVRALLNHDSTLLLGRTRSKTLTLTDSPEGLRYKLSIPNTTAGNDLFEQVSRGDLDGTSFGFRTKADSWAADGEGNTIRTLLDIELIEVSPTGDPAYSESHVDLRSAPAEIRSRIEQRRACAKPETPTAKPETPVIDEELENLMLRVAIRSRKK